MKTLKVYGASDDLIETSGIEGCDEFGCYSDSPYKGKLLIQVDHATFGIHVIYDGQWVFAIVNDIDDESPIEYSVQRTFGKDIAYSETIEIDVPDQAYLVFLQQ